MDNNIIELFVCADCSKRQRFEREIKCAGKEDNLFFAVKNSSRNHVLEPIDFLSDKKLYDFLHSDGLEDYLIPKFGKFEFENYIANEFKKAIFVTNDLTDLFNTLLVYDYIKLSEEKIQKKFDIILEAISDSDFKTVYKIREDKLKEAMEAYYG